MITEKIKQFIGIKSEVLFETQEERYTKDIKALVIAGLQIADDDEGRLAKLLNINVELLDNILKDRIVLNKDQADKIRRNFVQRIALYDSLSSLENTMNFRATLYNLAECKSISLLFVKFNEYNDVNEKYGYETSDEILQQAAARVSQEYPCAYVSKIKRNKFCLVFANKNKYQARQLVKDIEVLLTSTYDLYLSGIEFNPTIKTTLVNYPEDVKTIDEVIKITKAEY